MRFYRRSRLMVIFVIFAGGLLLLINTTLYLNASKDVRSVRKRQPFEWSTVEHVPMHRQPISTSKVQLEAVNKNYIATKKNVNAVRVVDSRPLPVLISVKTGLAYHQTRVSLLLQTWFNYAPNETYFVTDTADENITTRIAGDHLVVSKCGGGHQRLSLCCKMNQEFEVFYHFGKSKDWFCHVDDDNYVNIPKLVHLLSQFDPKENFYIGRSSTGRTMKIYWEGRIVPPELENIKRDPFWFATGGAGFCVSRRLLDRMEPYVRNGKFVQLCRFTGLPDDCTVGFLAESVLGASLTQSRLLHSHLEMQRVPSDQLKEQVTFSYGRLGGRDTLIPVDGPFTKEEDPTRFKSYHCLLNPQVKWCPT